MEFEVLDEETFPTRVLDGVRRFAQSPRRQMQAWGDRAPHLAGAVLLALVVVEWVLSQRLAGGLGRGPSAMWQALQVTAVILLGQSILVGAASGLAAITGKAGNRGAAMTYLNLGLMPLLLVLPFTLLCEAAAAPAALRKLLLLLLILKVLGLWRAAIETVYKLNRLQSAAAFYATAGGAVTLILLVVYVGIIAKVSSALS